MFDEYAIDPASFESWQDVRYIVEKFSWEQGRLLSRFPKAWPKLVIEQFKNARPLEKARVTETLAQVRTALLSRNRSFDPNRPWASNAIRSHEQESPFQAIISPEIEYEIGIKPEDLSDTHDLFRSSTGAIVRRDADEIIGALKLAILVSRKILVIDPHFNPGIRRFNNTAIRLIEELAQRSDLECVDLQFHFSDTIPLETLKRDIERRLVRHIPNDLSVSFFQWDKPLHNRYILTEKVGVLLGTGIDEASGVTYTQEDDIRILDRDTLDHWSESFKSPEKEALRSLSWPFGP